MCSRGFFPPLAACEQVLLLPGLWSGVEAALHCQQGPRGGKRWRPRFLGLEGRPAASGTAPIPGARVAVPVDLERYQPAGPVPPPHQREAARELVGSTPRACRTGSAARCPPLRAPEGSSEGLQWLWGPAGRTLWPPVSVCSGRPWHGPEAGAGARGQGAPAPRPQKGFGTRCRKPFLGFSMAPTAWSPTGSSR